MSGTEVIAVGAVSGLGRAGDAYIPGRVGETAPTAIRDDAALAAAGLNRARASRAESCPREHGDRAVDLLVDAFGQVMSELDTVRPQFRDQRVGVCIGTSSGGMISAERFFTELSSNQRPTSAVDATYFAPLDRAVASAELTPTKQCQVVAACASSTIAIGLGMRWLERDACDIVLAGGYDGVGLFVAAGFEALRATSASMPQPFRTARDGMLLGEGAAVIALVRAGGDNGSRGPYFFVNGFGASADAVHITAPDREGGGLVRAGRRALEDAGCDASRVDLVSAHGTSTPYNDAAEAKAIRRLAGDPIVHPFKAQIGHTLGAAGVLELLAAGHCLRTQVAPAAFGDGEMDPEATVTLLERAETRKLDAALKLSAAFGGVTAALVLERAPAARPERIQRPVHVAAFATVDEVDRNLLADKTGIPLQKIARIDALGQWGLAAVAALVDDIGREAITGAGVVGGYGLATLDTNKRFHERLLKKGPRWVDPRLFPATSPNAGAGHVAIAYGLTGPCFAVNGGLAGSLEALAAAAELVASGDVARMLVVAADDDGEAAHAWHDAVAPDRPHRPGAVAVLLVSDPGTEESGLRRIDLDADFSHLEGPTGHLALRAWLDFTGNSGSDMRVGSKR